ncbi:AraC family transcriptional regulator [Tahibacter amnicola]|uniref:AraC family transcriptional regulator n=1 Tax=Tahibacter amnicola TaxID=2976241 RepID=A0ABY6B6V1_9GAMM|nr:AraC family transcriptional regulator [Tahibacter amnicola]UXI65828.1 AraC family transcriptional regulator [Tahibacter amnicola]
MTDHDPWACADPLGEALHFLRMSGAFYARSELSSPWGLDLPPLPHCLMFHVVVTGQSWLYVDERAPVLLRPGDLALVPHGAGHRLLSDPDAVATPLFDIPREFASERYEVLHHGGGGAPTRLICGAVRFDHAAAQQLITRLPSVLLVETATSPAGEWIHSTLRLMAAEAQSLRPGGETVITRLADILVIQAIREWIARDPAAQTGWLGALQDKQIGRAITAIHRHPDRPWSLETLAEVAAMSRSAFAARFTERVGVPAMHYVTQWRMNLAQTWLKDDGVAIADLAGRLGYQSEAAFSRTFKRVVGVSPGAVKRAGRPIRDALPGAELARQTA